MKVLIATDGSDFSSAAIEKFRELVNHGNPLEVKIISVVERLAPMVAEPFAVSSEYYADIERESRKKASEFVAEARKKIAGENVSIQTEIFTGNVKKIIVEEAKDFGADLIVAGSHGKGFFERALLGSVSDFVLHHAPCSVLVVRT